MTINEMHERFLTLKRQGQGAYHSREEIDRFLNDGSTDKFNEEKRLFELNSYISDNLRMFKKEFSVTFVAGIGSLPTDYGYRTNAATADNIKVEIVPQGEWFERINDPIAVPTATEPVCLIRDVVEIWPSSVTYMKLNYLKKPAIMVFGYTEDVDGNTIYDSGSSTDPDWPDECIIDIIIRALKYAGVALPDQVLLQARTLIKQPELL